MFINPGQNKRLHQLLTELHLMDMKGDLILDATDGRTSHSSEMLVNEANNLIKHLEEKATPPQPSPKMGGSNVEEFNHLRKKIISLMIEMWAVDDKGKADMHFIYWFSINYIHKKKLNELNLKELHSMISIIQTKWLPWYYKQKKTNVDFSITQLRITPPQPSPEMGGSNTINN